MADEDEEGRSKATYEVKAYEIAKSLRRYPAELFDGSAT